MNSYLKAMRLERWPRSTAILVGSAALFVLDPTVLSRLGPAAIAVRVAGAFLLTWAVSTANYIINEIADAPFDVHHPTKRNRPLASGAVRKGPLVLWAAVIGGVSLALAWFLYSRTFLLTLLALVLAGFAYNVKPVRTKDVPFLDSISESVNNPIRFLIGWYALAPQAFPPWSLLVCWWAFGNFLMVAKRLSEYRFLGDRAGDYRASLRRYTRGTLLFGMGASAAVLFAAYFAFAAAFGLTASSGSRPSWPSTSISSSARPWPRRRSWRSRKNSWPARNTPLTRPSSSFSSPRRSCLAGPATNERGTDVELIDILLKLVLAIALGGLIGLEREASQKPAGFRTNILVCVGSAMMMSLAAELVGAKGGTGDSLLRMAAGVITGIGFLGAGTIVHAKGIVAGLTTASTLWVVAGLGLVIGSGYYVPAILFTALIMFTLVLFRKLEDTYLHKTLHQYSLKVGEAAKTLSGLRKLGFHHGIKLERLNVKKDKEGSFISFSFTASEEKEQEFNQGLLGLGGIDEFRIE